MDKQETETMKFSKIVCLQVTCNLQGEFIIEANTGELLQTLLGPETPTGSTKIQKIVIYRGEKVPDDVLEKLNSISVYKALQEALRVAEQNLPKDTPIREEEVLMNSQGKRLDPDSIN